MEQNFFDKLLNKPERYRKKVAYITTAVLGLFIFSAWLMVMNASLKEASTNTTAQPNPTEELKKKLPSLQEETAKTQLMKEQEQGKQPSNAQSPGFDSLLGNQPKPEEFKVIER